MTEDAGRKLTTELAPRGPRRRRRGGDGLVTVTPPDGPAFAPATVTAQVPGLELSGWLDSAVSVVRELVAAHGAVRLRGMSLAPEQLGDVVSHVVGSPVLDYVNRSTPRQRVVGNVFTSTEYNPSLAIPMHNEQSYTTAWPLLLGFHGVQPSHQGGATPLCSSARLLQELPESLVARFREHGVAYERWYQPHIDLGWQEVFQTQDPDEVTAVCAESGIEARWQEDGTLWTRQVAQATTVHPVSGQEMWFNQANLFHVAALPPAMRQALRDSAGERLPRNATFGDGEPIDDAHIELINATYERLSWAERWQKDDVVLVDNLAVAHGRLPYEGDRRILVAMAGTSTSEGGR